MKNHTNSPKKFFGEDVGKDKIEIDRQRLFEVLKNPQSRRMAATAIGYKDQTYMVTKSVYDWLNQGKAFVIGSIKCSRSGYWVQSITKDPEKTPINRQLPLFKY